MKLNRTPFLLVTFFVAITTVLFYGFQTKIKTHSQLQEWGLKGPIQFIETWYTYDSELWSLETLDEVPLANRRTVTYYNLEGNMDSIVDFNIFEQEEEWVSTIRFEEKKDTIYGEYELRSGVEATSKQYPVTDQTYLVVMQGKRGYTFRYLHRLNDSGQLQSMDIEEFKDGRWEKTGVETNYFSASGALDSIRMVHGQDRITLVNRDFKKDDYGNALQSVKQKGEKAPYFIRRKLSYRKK